MPRTRKSPQQQAAELLAWMRANQPRVYEGLARRFASRPSELSGLFDSLSTAFSSAVNAVGNFLGSQGGDKLLQAAQPFITTKLEKEQLQNQIKRLQAGLPLTAMPASAGVVNTQTYSGLPLAPFSIEAKPFPWLWVAGGVGGGLLLMAMMNGGGRRR